jgi:RNA 3'-terminal phosphate cyclase-like protein
VDPVDPDSDPDLSKTSTCNVFNFPGFFPDDEGLEIKIVKRGAAPLGGGQVLLRCPVKRQLKPLQFTDQGKIKRIRGTAWAVRVSPSVPNRVVEAAKASTK